MKKQYFVSLFILSLIAIKGYSNTTGNSDTITKESHAIAVPVFPTFGPYCQGSFIPSLPTISLNNISGTWSPAVIDPNTSATYTFTPDVGQVASSVSVNITIVIPPEAGVLAGVQTVCVGFTTSFTSTSPGGSWTSANTSIATINAVTGIVTGMSPGTTVMTYTVPGIAPCVGALATRIVTVNAAPSTGTLSGPQFVCPFGTAQLTSTEGGGIWVSSDNNVASVDPISGLVTAVGNAGTAMMSYTVTDPNGCGTAMAILSITVAIPTISLNSGAAAFQTVCVNSLITPIAYTIHNGAASAQLTAGALPPGVTGTFNASTGQFTISGTATAAGNYNFDVSTSGGCITATRTGTITVLPNVATQLSSPVSTSNQTKCFGTPIDPIIYTVSNGATSASVTGLPAGIVAIFAAGTLTITGTSTIIGVFNYTMSTVGGCGLASLSGTITITPNAAVLIFCDPTNVTTSPVTSVAFDWNNIGSSNYQYAYSISGGPVQTGSTNISNYEVFGVLPGQSVTFSINAAAGITCFEPATATCTLLADADFETVAFGYYPNPVKHILNLTGRLPITNIEIHNVLGQQVLSRTFNSKSIEINTADFTKGVYLVKVTSGTNTQTIKVFKD